MLSVTVEDQGEVAILHCVGRLDRDDETSLLCAAIQQCGRNITLDLSKVEGIDAAGIGVLISLQAAGIYLKLVNPTTQVREVLRVTGLESIFEIGEVRLSGETLPPSVARVGSATSCLPEPEHRGLTVGRLLHRASKRPRPPARRLEIVVGPILEKLPRDKIEIDLDAGLRARPPVFDRS